MEKIAYKQFGLQIFWNYFSFRLPCFFGAEFWVLLVADFSMAVLALDLVPPMENVWLKLLLIIRNIGSNVLGPVTIDIL